MSATLFSVAFIHASVRADEPAALGSTNSAVIAALSASPFGWLDRRSAYFQDAFPEPLLVDDTSLEEGEMEFGFMHTQTSQQQSDVITAGAQESFGLLTGEVEVPFERNSYAGQVSRGIGSIDVSARYPIWQYVTTGGFFDTTFGAGMEVGIPVNSVDGSNTEMTPKLFNDLKLGGHFTFQSVFGYSTLLGGGENGGVQTFEYGLVLGYAIPHSELPLPWIRQVTPLFELAGEMTLNKDEAGQNDLPASLGFRVDFRRIGEVESSVALGFIFPTDSATRDDLHWGIVTGITVGF